VIHDQLVIRLNQQFQPGRRFFFTGSPLKRTGGVAPGLPSARPAPVGAIKVDYSVVQADAFRAREKSGPELITALTQVIGFRVDVIQVDSCNLQDLAG